MKFGPIPVQDSKGAVVGHTIRHGELLLKKGKIVRAADVEALERAGIDEIVAAQLEAGDVGEDAAALRIAEKIAGAGVRVEAPFTGRSNLFSEKAGVLTIDVEALDRLNAVHEDVTVATLPPYRTVVCGEMIVTVKIIPFAVSAKTLCAALQAVEKPLIEVRPFRPLRLGVISTLLPGLKPSVVDKTIRTLGERIAPAGATILQEIRVPHEADALAPAIKGLSGDCDLVVVFGASAITDRRDVIPAAVEAAGGSIDRFGMPVDPGNLLLLAKTAEGKPLLGAPGCARSPKENGFDWVLMRLLAGVPVLSKDIRAMGAGGLLMEIISRPQPRAGSQTDVETATERLSIDD